MSQAVVAALVAIAKSFGRADVDRQAATRRFQAAGAQLRAALPPLGLPVRTGTPASRIGLLAFTPGLARSVIAFIGARPALLDVDWRIYVRAMADAPPAANGAPGVAALEGMSDLAAARLIAESDLDVLVDIDSGALAAAPVLLALRPARVIVEPAFDPPATGAGGRPVTWPGDDVDTGGLLAAAMAAAAALERHAGEPLPSPAMLNAELDRAIQWHQAGRTGDAAAGYRSVLARYAWHPVAAYMLGQLETRSGEPARATEWFGFACRWAPEFRDAQLAHANRLSEAGRWREALEAARRAIELGPGHAPSWSALGLAAMRTTAATDPLALTALERAVALDPSNPQWQFNLGAALQKRGNLARAGDLYRGLIDADPGQDEARFNLAAIAQEKGDIAGAMSAYRVLLQRRPDHAAAYGELGTCLQLAGQVDAWVENFGRYRARCPESLAMAVYGLEASMAAGDPAAHLDWRDRILAGAFAAADAEEHVRNWEQLLFLLLHVDADRAVLAQWYRRYDAAAGECYGPPLERNPARAPGRPRVGYLSGDLRDHVMGRMIHQWLTGHDRTRLDIRLYSLSRRADGFTQRIRELGLPFVDLAAMRHEEAAARIRADDVDLLIDCCGHTRGAQPGILALAPARVSATSIATPGPLGLSSVNYRLTDALAEAGDNQQFLIEQLVPVEGGIYPWRRHPAPPEAGRKPVRAAGEPLVCAAFVSLMKLSPRCLALWRRMLEAVPRAVLAFSPQNALWEPAYRRWLAAHGIPAGRIRFTPCPSDAPGQLARYGGVDVALDPLPCGNVNGTMEALAMGVPVVTLVGLRHGERLGHALLTRFGVTSTIAADEASYVEHVRRLSDDPSWARNLREEIRHALDSSPVFDASSRLRQLEAAYLRMLDEQGVVADTGAAP